MKKITIILMLTLAMAVQAQQNEQAAAYYRNALTSMILYHSEDAEGKRVCEILDNLPKQEKYDDHPVGFHVIDNMKLTGIRKGQNGVYRQEYGKDLVLSQAQKDANGQAILKLLNKADCGKRMVAKWFDLHGDSLHNAYFGSSVLESRTLYNVSALEAEKLRYTVEGKAALKDITTELLEHSFVLVTEMTYITAERRAEAAKTTMNVLGGLFDALTGSNYGERTAEIAGEIADDFTGYKVFTNTYLYQLNWSDSLTSEFYENYYTESPDPARMRKFWSNEVHYSLSYLGVESSVYELTQKNGKYNQNELLELIMARSLDKNIMVLQGQYEAFRVRTPITAAEYDQKGRLLGYRAPVGIKEGVDERSEFEVLEAKVVGTRIEYSRVGVLRAVNNQIWDNRFNALLELDNDQYVSGTLFKPVGSPMKEILPGMLIRLKK